MVHCVYLRLRNITLVFWKLYFLLLLLSAFVCPHEPHCELSALPKFLTDPNWYKEGFAVPLTNARRTLSVPV